MSAIGMLRQSSLSPVGACHNWRVFRRNRIILGVVLVLAGLCVGTLLPPMRYSIWWDAVCTIGGVVAILYGLMAVVRACAPYVSLTLLRVIGTALLVSYIGWGFFAFLGSAFQKSGDLGHCQDFIDAAVHTNAVPQSVSSPGQPAAFCAIAEYGILRSSYQVIETYSVPRNQQQTVLAALTTAHHRVNGAAVQVVFYEKENWRIGGPYNADGTLADKGGTVIPGSASRGPEKIQRIAIIR